jgi:hypothetical protein
VGGWRNTVVLNLGRDRLRRADTRAHEGAADGAAFSRPLPSPADAAYAAGGEARRRASGPTPREREASCCNLRRRRAGGEVMDVAEASVRSLLTGAPPFAHRWRRTYRRPDGRDARARRSPTRWPAPSVSCPRRRRRASQRRGRGHAPRGRVDGRGLGAQSPASARRRRSSRRAPAPRERQAWRPRRRPLVLLGGGLLLAERVTRARRRGPTRRSRKRPGRDPGPEIPAPEVTPRHHAAAHVRPGHAAVADDQPELRSGPVRMLLFPNAPLLPRRPAMKSLVAPCVVLLAVCAALAACRDPAASQTPTTSWRKPRVRFPDLPVTPPTSCR